MKSFYYNFMYYGMCASFTFLFLHTVVNILLVFRARKMLLKSINRRAHVIAEIINNKMQNEQNISEHEYRLFLLGILKREIEELNDNISKKLLQKTLNARMYYLQLRFASSFFRKSKVAALV